MWLASSKSLNWRPEIEHNMSTFCGVVEWHSGDVIVVHNITPGMALPLHSVAQLLLHAGHFRLKNFECHCSGAVMITHHILITVLLPVCSFAAAGWL